MSSHVYNLKIYFKYSQSRNGNPYMIHNPSIICLLLISQHPLLASLHTATTPAFLSSTTILGLSWYSDGKESACNAGDPGLIPGSGRFPGEGNGKQLHYSYLENSMDRGAWWAAVRGAARSRTRLSDFTFTFYFHALEKNPLQGAFLPGESQGRGSLVG